MRDPFDLLGVGSAAELARQLSAVTDMRPQALAQLAAIAGPASLMEQMHESPRERVFGVGRNSVTEQVFKQVREELERAAKLRRSVVSPNVSSMFARHHETATSRFSKEALRIHDEMAQIDNLARIVGYRDISCIFGDIDMSATARMARDALRMQDDMDRQWKQLGIADIQKNLATLGIANPLGSAFDQLQSAAYADFISRDVARYLPQGISSQVEELVRSLDFDPVHRATRDLAELLERLREEDGDPENFDDVEERIEEADLTAFRKALGVLLADAFQKSTDRGLQAWVMLNVWFSSLSPLMKSLVEIAISTAVSAALASSHCQTSAPQVHASTSAAVEARARAANPTSRASELFFSERDVMVRSGPHSTQPLIGRIPARQLMRVTGRQLGWYRVRFVDPAGDGAQITGWVRAKGMKHANAETARMVWCMVTAQPDEDTCSDD